MPYIGVMFKPAPRHKDFPIGRVCMVCGKGGTVRLGGCYGYKPALLALGYEWDHATSLGYAHSNCITRVRKTLKTCSMP
jgi:hypothetical protein